MPFEPIVRILVTQSYVIICLFISQEPYIPFLRLSCYQLRHSKFAELMKPIASHHCPGESSSFHFFVGQRSVASFVLLFICVHLVEE